jgi:hypothetical protein
VCFHPSVRLGRGARQQPASRAEAGVPDRGLEPRRGRSRDCGSPPGTMRDETPADVHPRLNEGEHARRGRVRAGRAAAPLTGHAADAGRMFGREPARRQRTRFRTSAVADDARAARRVMWLVLVEVYVRYGSYPHGRFLRDAVPAPGERARVALNPFEEAALPYLTGRVLDLGCGLGNLGVAVAICGCEVVAVDASPIAIEHLSQVSQRARCASPPCSATSSSSRYASPSTLLHRRRCTGHRCYCSHPLCRSHPPPRAR